MGLDDTFQFRKSRLIGCVTTGLKMKKNFSSNITGMTAVHMIFCVGMIWQMHTNDGQMV
jgi:hypothetical protein